MDLPANLLLTDRELGSWPGSSLHPDPLPAWGFMGLDGAPRTASLTRESGVLGYSPALKQPWGMQQKPRPAPPEMTKTAPGWAWDKQRSGSTLHEPEVARVNEPRSRLFLPQ